MRKKIYIFTALILVTVFLLGISFSASGSDPLITLSYLEQRLQTIISMIGESGGSKYEVLQVKAGQTILFADSTEVIVRSGKAFAIASESGGLSDVTSGVDLKSNDIAPANHLLIVPRNDGRGLKVTEDSWMMVKGSYTVKESN